MYLNIIQLAESFGVEERVIDDWIRKESLPVIQDRGRLLFDRSQAAEWAASRGLAAKAGFLAPAQKSNGSRRLEWMLRAGGIFRDVQTEKVPEILGTIVAKLPGATAPIRQLLAQRLRAPQGISWAAIGGGLALPHLRAPVALGRDAGVLAVVILRDALAVNGLAPDNAPVTRLLFFIAPSPRAHLEMLAQLSAALSCGNFRQLLLAAAPDEQILAALAAAEKAGAAIPKETKP